MDLDTPMHIDSLRHWKSASEREALYGLQWGDPQINPILRAFRDRFLMPYVGPDSVCVEIGPGGGRWTRYMMACEILYVVDYHQELLDELADSFRRPGLKVVKNNGCDFPGIPENCAHFVFSFGVFVHLDVGIIDRYLANIRNVLNPTGCAVIQYSDKRKLAAQQNTSFSENYPDIMRNMVRKHGYHIQEEDTESLWHSSVVRFSLNG